MDMRWSIPTVFSFIIVSVLILILHPTNGSEDEPGSYFIHPEEPQKGEMTTIQILVVNDSSSPVMGVRLSISGKFYYSFVILNNGSNQTHSIDIYMTEVKFGESGDHVVTEQHLVGSEWSDIRSFNVTIYKEKAENDKILGLPDWYCSIGVLILTITLIFITWAYFRGRRIQKSRIVEAPGQIKCSDCGRSLAGTEEHCPYCGVELTGEEYLCGKCGKMVGPSDERCGACGSRLGSRKEIITKDVGSRRSPKRKNGKISKSLVSDSLKNTCDGCGTVLLRSELTCPICGKLNR